MLEELPDPLPEGEGFRFGLLPLGPLGLSLLDLLGPDEDLDALGRAVAAVRQGLRLGGGVHEKEVAIFPGELVPGVLDEAGDVVLGVLHLAGLAETPGGGAQGGGEAVQGLLGAAVRLLPGALQHGAEAPQEGGAVAEGGVEGDGDALQVRQGGLQLRDLLLRPVPDGIHAVQHVRETLPEILGLDGDALQVVDGRADAPEKGGDVSAEALLIAQQVAELLGVAHQVVRPGEELPEDL